MVQRILGGSYKVARRIVIAIIGGTVLTLGIVMLVAPGPGIAAVAAGLAILAVEFTWARAWLRHLRRKVSDAGNALRGRSIDGHRD